VIGGNWSAKLEYLYGDLGRTSGSFASALAATTGGGGVATAGTLTSGFSSRISDNVLRAGLNYKLGGPVVARY
jgi:outer membrane immunogenic protein